MKSNPHVRRINKLMNNMKASLFLMFSYCNSHVVQETTSNVDARKLEFYYDLSKHKDLMPLRSKGRKDCLDSSGFGHSKQGTVIVSQDDVRAITVFLMQWTNVFLASSCPHYGCPALIKALLNLILVHGLGDFTWSDRLPSYYKTWEMHLARCV
jgi:hypothetical protein